MGTSWTHYESPDEQHGDCNRATDGVRPERNVTLGRNEHESVAVLRATLDASTDAVLVTDPAGDILLFNSQYARMFNLSDEMLASRRHDEVMRFASCQFRDPATFIARAESIGATSDPEPDILEMVDGRIIERLSKRHLIDGREIGRMWSFRDVTEHQRAQEAMREYARALKALNRIGSTVASGLDVGAIVRTFTDAATQLTGAQFGAFFWVDAAGQQYTLYASSAPGRAAAFPLSRDSPIVAPIFRGERVLRVDDVLKHPVPGRAAHTREAASDVRSYLAVPVISRTGEVHGGLFFGHTDPGRFTERHEIVVGGIAAQAAVVLDNSQLFQTAQQATLRLQQLNDTLELKVTERTTQLHKSELQFQQLVAGVVDYAIYMLDPKGYIVSWNPGAERIKGYSAQEIIGRNFSQFYTEEDRANGMPQRALATAEREGKYEAEAWRVRKDGTRFWANVLIDAIRGPDGSLIGFAKVTRDMTERRAMQEQLHQSQKMEAIGQLTGGVAHDFNNLLTVILGNLETIWRELPNDGGRLRRAVDQATRGAQRAATLTQQLLAFSRRQPLNPKPTDVNRLMSGFSDLVRRTLSEDISIETVLGGGLWRIEVDAHQLESALLNLAVNSRDAMPEGGKLTIETANVRLDEQYASQYADIKPGQYVVICVSDTGVGMTREVMARAFDPFFTTKPLGSGTGLGLSQVFGFVKQSGGHVKLYSEVGQGTTIKVYLPRLICDVTLVEAEPAPPVPTGRSTETILVVEDDEDVRRYSTECLRELGFSIFEAASGSVALRVLDHHPEINLLFTDVGLPGINGRQLVDEARRRRPGLRVLFTTGYARNAIVHHGRLDPGLQLLTKPFTRAQLASRVRDVLDAQSVPMAGQGVALVVEDEPLVRMFVAQTLEQRGLEAVQVGTAREGLDAAQRLHNAQLAFVDVGLPDRNGLELAAELRRRWPHMPIIVASGYTQHSGEKLRNDERVLFLTKPFDAPAVARALDTLGVAVREIA